METKSFRFQTGVDLSIGADLITAGDNSGMDKMDSKNIDSFNYEEFAEPRIPPAGLCTIPFVLGFFLVLIGGGDGTPLFYLGTLLMVIGVLGFVFIFFDSMLHTNSARKLIARFWAYKGYAVTIGNKSGNNILFYTQLDELSKIKSVEAKIDELKAYLSSQDEAKKPHQSVTPTSNLDELEKLAKLRDSGVITEDEFSKKKKELLGL